MQCVMQTNLMAVMNGQWIVYYKQRKHNLTNLKTFSVTSWAKNSSTFLFEPF